MKQLGRIALGLGTLVVFGVALATCGGGGGGGGGGAGSSGVGGVGGSHSGGTGGAPAGVGTCASTCQKSIAKGCPSGVHDQSTCEASCNQQQSACAAMASAFQAYLDCIQTKPIECGSVTDAPSSPDCLSQGLAILACSLNVDGGTTDGGADASPFPATPVTVVTETEAISAIAVDSGKLYWAVNTASGTIKVMDLPGGTPTPVATNQMNPYTLAVDATGVYWTTVNLQATTPVATLMRLAPGSATATPLSTALSFPVRLALGGTAVYVLDSYVTEGGTGGGVLYSIPKAGGTPVDMFRHGDSLWRMAVDGTHVWVSSQNVAPGLFRVPTAGGAAVRVTDDIQHPLAGSVALDDTNAYWADWSGSVLTMPKAGGAITTVTSLASAFDIPSEVALEGDYVYFTSALGGIWRVLKTGGQAQALKTSGTNANAAIDGFAVTPTGIYFNVPVELKIKFIAK